MKKTRQERVELGELRRLIDCLIGEVREVRRMLDIKASLNATPATSDDIPIVEPKMPSSPTDITMEQSKHVEALVNPW